MEWSRQGRTRARMRMRCASEISASTIYAPMSTDAASSVGLVAPWAYFLVSYMPLACYRGQSSVNSQNACSAAQKGPSGYGPKTCKAAAAVASTADRCPRSRGLHRHNASCTAQRPTPTKKRSAYKKKKRVRYGRGTSPSAALQSAAIPWAGARANARERVLGTLWRGLSMLPPAGLYELLTHFYTGRRRARVHAKPQ